MAPSWSARLPFGSSSSNRSNASSQPSRFDAGKPLPPAPSNDASGSAIPPLNSPQRPRTSHATSLHQHNRSVSQPIPKFFGRKKSAGNLGSSYNTDLPFDDSLVPVLDDSPVEQSSSSIFKTTSGRKKSQNDAQDTRVVRRCMCCDSKIKVPKELDKFRCMCCLTINDLQPLAKQRQEHERRKRKEHGLPLDRLAGVPPAPPQLTIERTRAIIQRCLFAYLESRSRGRGADADDNMRDITAIRTDPLSEAGDPTTGRQEEDDVLQLPTVSDGPLSQSPPTTPMDVRQPYPPGSPSRMYQSAHSNEDATHHPLPLLPPARASSAPQADRQTSISRKPVPSQPTRKPPPPPPANGKSKQHAVSQNLRVDIKGQPRTSDDASPKLPSSTRPNGQVSDERRRYERVKTIFRPLENYLSASFGSFASLNTSFSTLRPTIAGRARSESHIQTPPPELASNEGSSAPNGLDELDAKTLLLGDIGENGSWWTGKLGRHDEAQSLRRKKLGSDSRKAITSRSPNVNWTQVAAWYAIVHTAGQDWQRQLQALQETSLRPLQKVESEADIAEIDIELREARSHTVRALLKITENILRRPGKILKDAEDLRWLFIILANPSLHPSSSWLARSPPSLGTHRTASPATRHKVQASGSPTTVPSPSKQPSREAAQHFGLVKRIFGLLANCPDTCHRYIIGWLSRLYEEHFTSLVDLCASFITHRIVRSSKSSRASSHFVDGGLIPDLSGGAMQTSAQLHSAMGLAGSNKKRADGADGDTDWADDWQAKCAAKVMSLLFAANNNWQGRRREDVIFRVDSGLSDLPDRTIGKPHRIGQLLHASSFYNSLLDYQDLITDFKVWESHKEKFSFCQYPLFLSMGAKIKILEYDARRQMEIKAREAIFDQVVRQRAIESHFHLRIRRDCMVEDSLRQISEAVGSGQEELKKGLRVHFNGEEGVDAGGPRKEWFLMLVREVFDADHGLFVYDDDSNTCYFNPNTFETSDQYYLVGALLGLAIYNSTILDIALPSFAFRKLLAAAPPPQGGLAPGLNTRSAITYSLADLAEYKPTLAAGLRQLLEFEGDVEATYCWSFVAPVERYGLVAEVPLMANGENTAVTNANRQEFVDAYVRYLLDTAVARQFEPFKRGFFTVCAGNALSLFRAEEIELLVRGSDEALDVDSLRGVAVYENWRYAEEPHKTIKAQHQSTVPIIEWFWQAFESAAPEKQRKLLTFVTGSDRIPAVGATSLVLRIVAGGDGWSGIDSRGRDERQRYPIARTCFNMLVLWRYDSREQLEQRLWRAVEDSEGFGLK